MSHWLVPMGHVCLPEIHHFQWGKSSSVSPVEGAHWTHVVGYGCASKPWDPLGPKIAGEGRVIPPNMSKYGNNGFWTIPKIWLGWLHGMIDMCWMIVGRMMMDPHWYNKPPSRYPTFRSGDHLHRGTHGRAQIHRPLKIGRWIAHSTMSGWYWGCYLDRVSVELEEIEVTGLRDGWLQTWPKHMLSGNILQAHLGKKCTYNPTSAAEDSGLNLCAVFLGVPLPSWFSLGTCCRTTSFWPIYI